MVFGYILSFFLKIWTLIKSGVFMIVTPVQRLIWFCIRFTKARYFLIMLMLKNLVFVFLILAASFVYFHKKITYRTKKSLLLTKLSLFVVLITLNFTSDSNDTKFIIKKIKPELKDKYIDLNGFEIFLKDSEGELISIESELKHDKNLKIYYNPEIKDLKFLIFNILSQRREKAFLFKFKQDPENWKNNSPYILQGIKNDLLSYSKYEEPVIVFENLTYELLSHDFIDLLLMFESTFEKMKFVILEDKKENFELLRQRYEFVSFRTLDDIDPEVFKSMIISIILSSKRNRMTDVQAARMAHKIYQKNGASLSELKRVYKSYN